MQTLEQNDKPTGEPLLPLVRLGLILPFVEALDRLGADADAILMGNALMRETVHRSKGHPSTHLPIYPPSTSTSHPPRTSLPSSAPTEPPP